MSQQISRNLLIAEAIVIALPVSTFAIITTVFFVFGTGLFPYDWLYDWLAVLSILCLAAIFSGWYLFSAYLQGGASALQKQNISWWLMIVVGVLILTASMISRLLPPSPERSTWEYFRSDLHMFTLALPVLIPIGHLAYERFFRKQIIAPIYSQKILLRTDGVGKQFTKPLRSPFIKQWILFNFLGWLVGLLVGFLLYWVSIPPFSFTRQMDIVLESIILSIPLGISVGTMQGLVIRHWKLSFSSWCGISILGTAIATLINIRLFRNGILGKDITDIYLAPVFVGFIVAVFQTILLRKSISTRILWVFSHIFGFLMALLEVLVIYAAAFLFADPIIKALEALQFWDVVWNRDLVLITFNILTFSIWLAVITGFLTGNILHKAFGSTQTG